MNCYLQWYPFNKHDMKSRLLSEEYFEDVIKSGYFISDESIMTIQSNFLQKFNGQYRQSQLISPVLYLILQAACINISDEINVSRKDAIEVFYSGNIDKLNPSYEDEYSMFYKRVIFEKDNFSYYMKIDLSDYYSSISIDKLFSKIEHYSKDLDQNDLLMFKELLNYIGNGRFPLIQNSMGTSYLATEIYLSEIDNKIFERLHGNNVIKDFKMIRYVDDLYILFDTDLDELNLRVFFEETQKFLNASFYKEYLNLNFEKMDYGESSGIVESLYGPFYDEIVNGEVFDIYEISKDVAYELLTSFLDRIESVIEQEFILTNQKYMDIVSNTFVIEDSDLSPREILNRIIYSNDLEFNENPLKAKILNVADYRILRVSPRIFSSLLLSTKDGAGIRSILNNLFEQSRNGDWILNDLDVAIIYLLNRGFQHGDLISKLVDQSNEPLYLQKYINNYCLDSVWNEMYSISIESLKSMKITVNTQKIYFLYLVNQKRDDYLAAYSYFKSYFDRITAEFAWFKDNFTSRISYHQYYKQRQLIDFYSFIDESEDIISNAAKYRNKNPINHGAAEILADKVITKEILEESIEALTSLRDRFISENN